MTTIKPPEPCANKHSFAGSYAPAQQGNIPCGFNTFSVGIFKWIPKANKKGFKKSAVKVRVKGDVSNADAVFAKALEICLKLDRGEDITQKSISVKTPQ